MTTSGTKDERTLDIARWECSLYGIHYTLVVSSWKAFVTYAEDLFEEKLWDEDKPEPYGHTLIHYTKPMQVIFWFPRGVKPTTTGWVAVIAHESLHAVMAVLTSRGIQVDDDYDEAATYYLQWVVTELHSRLVKRKK